MTVHQAPWTPKDRRAFKEILYRFMGEVHATKAALYLKTPDNAWAMATQYGFGRRDPLETRYADDAAIVRMVRAFSDDPRHYNDPAELGELREYLAGAGNSRMMLVPLVVESDDLIGFVDVRDKGAKHVFTAGDVELARSIAGSLTRVAVGAGPGEADDAPSSPSVAATAETPPPAADRSGRSEALLDQAGLDELNAGAEESLADERVVAVAVSVVDGDAGATLVHQRSGSAALEVEAVLAHQTDALGRASMPTPPRQMWRTEIRRSGNASGTARRAVIASAVLASGDGSAVVVSVVADGELAVARRVLESLGRRTEADRDRFRLRVAGRGLARRLLQPGNRRYPELVAHCLGASRLSWSIARRLGLGGAAVENAALAGLLHDVGMRELDYDRLYMHPTPGPEDRRTYRMHVEVGERIVRVEGFDEIADAVRHHHERWDGNGYPDRLAGTDIPLLARIVHVAEVFDLFSAANSYRPAVSKERALAILDRAAGHQFDPTVVEAMSRVVE